MCSRKLPSLIDASQGYYLRFLPGLIMDSKAAMPSLRDSLINVLSMHVYLSLDVLYFRRRLQCSYIPREKF